MLAIGDIKAMLSQVVGKVKMINIFEEVNLGDMARRAHICSVPSDQHCGMPLEKPTQLGQIQGRWKNIAGRREKSGTIYPKATKCMTVGVLEHQRA